MLASPPPVYIRGNDLKITREQTQLHDSQLEKLAKKFNDVTLPQRRKQDRLPKRLFLTCMGVDVKDKDYFLRRVFEVFDEKQKGYLTSLQFIKAIGFLRPGAPLKIKLRDFFAILDVNGKGIVSYKDWQLMCVESLRYNYIKITAGQFQKAARKCWDKLDRKKKGEINFDEFCAGIKGDDELKQLILQIDINCSWMKEEHWKWSPDSGAHEKPLSEFLKQILKTDGKEEDNAHIQEWVDELNKNFFHSVDALKDCTREDWAHMNLPLRLFSLVMSVLCKKNDVQMDLKTIRSAEKKQNKEHLNKGKTLMNKIRVFLYLNYQMIFQIICYSILLGYAVISQALFWCTGDKYGKVSRTIGFQFCISRVGAAAIIVNLSLIMLFVMHRTLGLLRKTYASTFFSFDISAKCHAFLGGSLLLEGLLHTSAHFVNFLHVSDVIPTDFNQFHLGICSVYCPTSACTKLENAIAENLANGDDSIIQLSELGCPDIPFADARPSLLQLHFASIPGVTGWVLIISIFLIWLTAHKKGKHFNTFFHIHHLYIVVVIAGLLHGAGQIFFKALLWRFFASSIFLFCVEKIYAIYTRQPLLSVISIEHLHKCMLIKFEKPDNFKYDPGNFVYIQIPEISRLEWHPFTLTSSPDEYFLSIHIRMKGDWCSNAQDHFQAGGDKISSRTTSLSRIEVDDYVKSYAPNIQMSLPLSMNGSEGNMLRSRHGGSGPLTSYAPPRICNSTNGGKESHTQGMKQPLLEDDSSSDMESNGDPMALPTHNPSFSEQKSNYDPVFFTLPQGHHNIPPIYETKIRMDGPIGTASADAFQYKYVMFIAGGIGVTPMASMLKDIRYKLKTRKTFGLSKVYFYWAARDQGDFGWFKDLLLELSEDDEEFLEVNIFLTSRSETCIRNVGLNMLLSQSKHRDLVTGLRARTVTGRPNFRNIFKQIREAHSGNDVGVFFCGPKRLGDTVHKLSLEESNITTNFVFRKEIF